MSFIKYVQKQQFGGDLFNQSSFTFDDSKSSKLIQIADFIGGTIAKGRDKTVLSLDAPRFYDIIENKIIAIKEWQIITLHILMSLKLIMSLTR